MSRVRKKLSRRHKTAVFRPRMEAGRDSAPQGTPDLSLGGAPFRIKGVTLLELIISAVLISMIVTGLAGLFVGAKKHLLYTRSRSTSGELGKAFLDPLHLNGVRQDIWLSSSCLGTGSAANCPDSTATLDTTYTAQYSVTPDYDGANSISKAKVDITW